LSLPKDKTRKTIDPKTKRHDARATYRLGLAQEMIAASRAEIPLKPSPDERLIALIIFIASAIVIALAFEKLCEKIHCFAISPPSNFPVVK
jgi:hypothetical protein